MFARAMVLRIMSTAGTGHSISKARPERFQQTRESSNKEGQETRGAGRAGEKDNVRTLHVVAQQLEMMG
eukprot:1363355-Rhodomonas_salina.1